MKKIILFTFFILAILLPTTASAHNFEVDGIYYLINGNEATVTFKGSYDSQYNEYSGSVTIPATVTYDGTTYPVTSIGEGAFSSCSSLFSINIPNSVTSIGDGAFSSCSSLISINIPNSVAYIGSSAFRECNRLTSVTIPNSVTYIGGSAFSGCSGLTRVNITDLSAWCKVTFISASSNPLSYAEHLYLDDKEVTDLIIPSSITDIKDYAFYRCIGLTNVTITNSVTSIGNYAFYYCTFLTSLKIGSGVTNIGFDAFSRCSSLSSVTIGSGVIYIGDYAFLECSSLARVNISDLTAWCNVTFTSASSNPLSYAEHLYLNDEEVTDLIIPSSITAIKDYAFQGCSGLTSVTIPNSVTTIGSRTFEGCRGLASIVVASGNPKYDSRNNCNGIIHTTTNTLISGCQNTTIPNSVTSIGDCAFQYCSSLISIDIPNSVTFIGEHAFSSCSSLTNVTIGSSVAYIGDYAFNFCNVLSIIKCLSTVPPVMASSGCFSSAAYNSARLLVPRNYEATYAATNYWYKFAHIEGWNSDGLGDIDGDGVVNITDVTILIDILLSGAFAPASADVYNDGIVNISDVTALIDMLLGSE